MRRLTFRLLCAEDRAAHSTSDALVALSVLGWVRLVESSAETVRDDEVMTRVMLELLHDGTREPATVLGDAMFALFTARVGWIGLVDERSDLAGPDDATPPALSEAEERACAWSDYRKDHGVPPGHHAYAKKMFEAGWDAARHGDQSGPVR